MIFNATLGRNALLGSALTMLLTSVAWAAGGKAKGTLAHKSKTVTLNHAYLIKGPDPVDPTTIIRSLILSQQDIAAKIQACKTMMCVNGALSEGMVVDLIAGPRLGYQMVINDGRVQHSGIVKPSVLDAKVDDEKRLAGRLSFDDTSASGPKVEVDFEASMFKEFGPSQ